jgi:hypothetical protein
MKSKWQRLTQGSLAFELGYFCLSCLCQPCLFPLLPLRNEKQMRGVTGGLEFLFCLILTFASPFAFASIAKSKGRFCVGRLLPLRLLPLLAFCLSCLCKATSYPPLILCFWRLQRKGKRGRGEYQNKGCVFCLCLPFAFALRSPKQRVVKSKGAKSKAKGKSQAKVQKKVRPFCPCALGALFLCLQSKSRPTQARVPCVKRWATFAFSSFAFCCCC